MRCSLFTVAALDKQSSPDLDQMKKVQGEEISGFDQVQSHHSILNLLHLESVRPGCRSEAPRLKMRATPEKAWHQSCPVEAECRSLEHVHLDCLSSCTIKNVVLQKQLKLDTDFPQIRY